MKRTNLKSIITVFFILTILVGRGFSAETACYINFTPGAEKWLDTDGIHINAHGGGFLYHDGIYYWFGEHKGAGRGSYSAQVGVRCYSSKDLYNWKNEGVALAVSEEPDSEITRGCVIERPKVIYNKKTGKFVMWFHLELRGQGYRAARTGVAVSDTVTGPYKYLRSYRPNPNTWPVNYSPYQLYQRDEIIKRDFAPGQMARDMTLFVDDDGRAYHIHASEENQTLHICELTEDYLGFTGIYSRVLAGKSNEAPAICKYNGYYYMIASDCTGWAPNAARSAYAKDILGPWKELGNPCRGVNPQNNLGPDKTFGGQSTFILPVAGYENAFIAMFDVWMPRSLMDSQYIWLPVEFRGNKIIVRWIDEWDLSVFDDGTLSQSRREKPQQYKIVWADEFTKDGKPNPNNWTYEHGFARNEELQWYQPDNAYCQNGLLIIEGRREQVPNPDYDPNSRNYRRRREYAEYTSSSLKTRGLHEWTFGRFEMKARIDTRPGLWPAFWTLGDQRRWPGCGEVDIMEYYKGDILANVVWAGNEGRNRSKWDSVKKPIADFNDTEWSSKFHVWRMDWDKDYIKLYVDDELLNVTDLSETINFRDGSNPFREPHYIMVNLAIGGRQGGDPSETEFPSKYEIDYIRVFQKD
ncbi:MAG: family 16 glycosylhydrolase [Sedimentisphaerales bacterium]|nr:family 16 glycosylhydrolase [Sedimentisphaerales bacterium]